MPMARELKTELDRPDSPATHAPTTPAKRQAPAVRTIEPEAARVRTVLVAERGWPRDAELPARRSVPKR